MHARRSTKRGVAALTVAVVGLSSLASSPRPAGALAAPVLGVPAVGPVAAGQPITVSVGVHGHAAAPLALELVVGFAAPTEVAMVDTGTGGDAVAGDGTYTATVPAQPAGTLVRYRVRVGNGAGSVFGPAKVGKRVYAGFLVARPAVTTALPVLDWYLAPADAQWLADNRMSNEYRPAVLVVGGEVIDGVEVRNQGGATRGLFPKPSFKFKLPKDVAVAAPFFAQPVEEFVADADHLDPTHGQGLAVNRLFTAAGVPERLGVTARVERGGAFWGVYQLYEELDSTWLDRVGFPVQTLYESEASVGHLVDEGSDAALRARWELREPDEDGPVADLRALATAVDGSGGPARVDAIVDRFDLPRLIDLLAMSVIVQHLDSTQNNNVLILDGATGRWRVVPNDTDITLGESDRTRLDLVAPLPLAGTTSALSADPELAAMVTRRLRTLADRHLAGSDLVDQVAAHVDTMRSDLALDDARWAVGQGSPDDGLADLADYVAFQRSNLAAATARGVIPPSQGAGARVVVSEIRATGDAGDFVELANPSATDAVDVSGWRLQGSTAVTLPGGTVVAPGARVVVPVSPQQVAARGRGIAVSGRLTGPLAPMSGWVEVVDGSGAIRDRAAWRTDGAWPKPAGSGRSIEARDLGADRTLPASWVLSTAPGGTPGAAGATARGLAVELWSGAPFAEVGAATLVRTTVRNEGAAARTDVRLDGPGTSCDRTVATLAAGGTSTSWCLAPPSPPASQPSPALGLALGTTDRLAATVRIGTGPVVASTSTFRPAAVGVDLAGPKLTAVRLGDGPLRFTGTLPPFSPAGSLDPSDDRAWRLEQQFTPWAGAAPQATVADPAVRTAATPVGLEGVLRLQVRSRYGITRSSAASPPITARASRLWPFASPGALADAFYRQLAGRAPTAAERVDWSNRIIGGTSPADLAAALLGGSRQTASTDPITRLYLAHLGRPPTAANLDVWVPKRRAGMTLDAVSAQFATSPDSKRRFAAPNSLAFAVVLFQQVLGRSPTPAEAGLWGNRVQAGLPRSTAILQLAESSEGLARTTSPVLATRTTYAFGAGVPTADQVRVVDRWLAAGGDRATLAEWVRSSAGYGSRNGA